MEVIPGDDEQLMVRSDTLVCILARDMRVVSHFDMPAHCGRVAASEEFIYATHRFEHITSFTHDGTEVAKYADPDKYITSPVLAPGGLLFCVLFEIKADYSEDEIVALDAQTLEPRYRFGQSMLNFACGMVVAGEELFVCDQNNDRLQVFSLAGEHRRSITGEWKQPLALCFVKDRLYLVEEYDDEDEDEEGELLNPQPGQRIFVLSLQGDTLQVYTHPIQGQFFADLCCFDGRLLAPVRNRQSANFKDVVALCGV